MRADLQANRHPGSRNRQEHGFGRKFLWFVVLWCAGTGSLAAVAFILRLWIG